jgi:hypothetical protein
VRIYEAIRLGSMLRPQGIDFFMKDGRSCAFGAALEAVGVEFDSGSPRETPLNVWPWLLGMATDPTTGLSEPLCRIIPDLNNEHGWTREQIADWLEPIEEAYLAKQPETVGALVEVA